MDRGSIELSQDGREIMSSASIPPSRAIQRNCGSRMNARRGACSVVCASFSIAAKC